MEINRFIKSEIDKKVNITLKNNPLVIIDFIYKFCKEVILFCYFYPGYLIQQREVKLIWILAENRLKS